MGGVQTVEVGRIATQLKVPRDAGWTAVPFDTEYSDPDNLFDPSAGHATKIHFGAVGLGLMYMFQVHWFGPPKAMSKATKRSVAFAKNGAWVPLPVVQALDWQDDDVNNKALSNPDGGYGHQSNFAAITQSTNANDYIEMLLSHGAGTDLYATVFLSYFGPVS